MGNKFARIVSLTYLFFLCAIQEPTVRAAQVAPTAFQGEQLAPGYQVGRPWERHRVFNTPLPKKYLQQPCFIFPNNENPQKGGYDEDAALAAAIQQSLVDTAGTGAQQAGEAESLEEMQRAIHQSIAEQRRNRAARQAATAEAGPNSINMNCQLS